jgi:membrane-bound lytic murein transglycosylase A
MRTVAGAHLVRVQKPKVTAALLLLVMAFATAGCASKPKCCPPKPDYSRPTTGPALVRAEPHEIPDFRQMYGQDQAATLAALDESIAYFNKPSSQKYFPYQTVDSTVTHEQQLDGLKTLREIYEVSKTPDEFHGRVLGAFDVYRSVGWDGRGVVLFTGYYTPIFEGSLTQDSRFRYPLYRRPADLVADEHGAPKGRRTDDGQVVSYYSRNEIEQNQILKGTELVWLSDPFEVYIVHVQGSARIRLPDGREMHVGYAGKTDKPYKSVGLELINRGKLQKEELSLARLKRYFREHPQEVEPMLGVNESYVFFAESQPGPFGSIGARVTPYHTIATDKAIFPRGGPVVASTRIPQRTSSGDRVEFAPHVGMYFDQDTGGAISAAGRADLYMGVGEEAERIAGTTYNEGKLFYLFLKPNPLRP